MWREFLICVLRTLISGTEAAILDHMLIKVQISSAGVHCVHADQTNKERVLL
jgi:hypothetical protein